MFHRTIDQSMQQKTNLLQNLLNRITYYGFLHLANQLPSIGNLVPEALVVSQELSINSRPHHHTEPQYNHHCSPLLPTLSPPPHIQVQHLHHPFHSRSLSIPFPPKKFSYSAAHNSLPQPPHHLLSRLPTHPKVRERIHLQ